MKNNTNASNTNDHNASNSNVSDSNVNDSGKIFKACDVDKNFFKSIKICLGFDFGTKRIGIAVGDSISKTAVAIKNIKTINNTPNWVELSSVIRKWSPDCVIVGLPLNIDGSEQVLSCLAKKFAQTLHNKFHLPVFLFDERLTTVESKRVLYKFNKKKSSIDSYAAKLITEDWMNSVL